MKKILIIILSIFTSATYAEINDYSTGNSNPVAKYNYSGPNSTLKKEDNLQYFSSDMANPKKLLSEKTKGKYAYLLNSSKSMAGCWDNAAKVYGIDPWMLMAIAKVESSFNHKAININKNKSADLGMMQINQIWLPTLKRFGINKEDLFNPCTSVFVGSWILAQNIRKFGYNQDGIGAYNSPRNVTIRRNYAQKVFKAYREVTNDLYYARNN
ncbi:lytic transglycosylase domain-containing protein [archaeon]|nr:lytic transglycosylase domain-containing protein [archaeon]